MDTVVEHITSPAFIAELGWPYRGKADGRVSISPTGVRTVADARSELPEALDRFPLLFLGALAGEADDACFHATDIADWLGTSWSKRSLLARLDRVLSCRIELPSRSGWQWMPIADWYWRDLDTGEVRISFARPFRTVARESHGCSLAVVRQLVRHIATLDLYLLLRAILSSRTHAPEWNIHRLLRSPGRPAKSGQQLRQRMHRITELWPQNPFHVIPRTRSITCSQEDYDRMALGIDRAAEKRHIRETIASKSRAEFDAYVQTLPPWERTRWKQTYAEDWIGRRIQADALSNPHRAQIRQLNAELAKQRTMLRASIKTIDDATAQARRNTLTPATKPRPKATTRAKPKNPPAVPKRQRKRTPQCDISALPTQQQLILMRAQQIIDMSELRPDRPISPDQRTTLQQAHDILTQTGHIWPPKRRGRRIVDAVRAALQRSKPDQRQNNKARRKVSAR